MVDISSIRCFGRDCWNYATPDEKKDSLQALERQCALDQNRIERKIMYQYMPDGKHGFYNPNRPEFIFVRQQDLYLSYPHEVVETVAHEGRHAYQHDCVNDPKKHPEIGDHQRCRWAFSLSCPVVPDPLSRDYLDDHEIYAKQPTEVDARQYASSITAQLKPHHEYNPTTEAALEKSNTEPNLANANRSMSVERLALLTERVSSMPPPPPPAPEPATSPSVGMRA